MNDTLAYLREQLGTRQPRVGLVLGSGLNFFAQDYLSERIVIPFSGIPGFVQATASFHEGNLVLGKCGDTEVLCMQGRFHLYEGYDIAQVTFPIRVMQALGIKTVVLTNASGGIRDGMTAGDLMLISDHLNFIGQNPLIGQQGLSSEKRFVDMTVAYDAELRQLALSVAEERGVALTEGVYLANPGPSFETPAEIRAYRTLGADAVGMSTVPEVIQARSLGMRVLAISCITNLAAGISANPLTAEEVMDTANRTRIPFAKLLEGVLEKL